MSDYKESTDQGTTNGFLPHQGGAHHDVPSIIPAPGALHNIGFGTSARRNSPSRLIISEHSRASSRSDRGSFSSVKEDLVGGPQAFLDSRSLKSSTIPRDAIASNSPIDSPAVMPVQVPHGPEFCCPCGSFRGWKQIRLGGRKLSKSYSDLRAFGGDGWYDWGWEEEKTPAPRPSEEPSLTTHSGQSFLERLPTEILDLIISYLVVDLPPNGYAPRNMDLMSCLLTSRTLHATTISILYRQITIPQSPVFSKFLSQLSQYPALGTVVRRLDLSHFTSVGLGRTRRMNAEIQNLTGTTLRKCLDLMPQLREFLAQEHIEDDLDEKVLWKIFCELPHLQAVDLSGCSSVAFRSSIDAVLSPDNPHLPYNLVLKRLCLHECSTISDTTLEHLLSRLPRLTHLDLAHTQVTNRALHYLPHTANLTHLNLSKCTHLTGGGVVSFLTTHPAVNESLVYLNLFCDISRYRLLNQEDVEGLLPKLPTSLRSLNLSGAKIIGEHVSLLLPLTKHLEELSLGYADLSVKEVNSLFIPPSEQPDGITVAKEEWQPSSLRYLDLTGVASITLGTLFTHSSVLLLPTTQPLEVIEFGEKMINTLQERPSTNERLGWAVRELGRRGWYVRKRKPGIDGASPDNGRRPWKMGAQWWGMRKVPVAWSEVGGLYGHYMFKK
ncbi:RNI-like protein [Xylona heveae TC161]|uniref:RNI-like protein n=1 Tax=Xylona heveae (strain CBS 132557 / TC161) TaxID=1328760 RepID=A0A165IGI5_XYLHT|nr:RNI-like protein [Xylona heveae TC161]KZF24861.1 RNI-like protein [Xylona heveae TC161]